MFVYRKIKGNKTKYLARIEFFLSCIIRLGRGRSEPQVCLPTAEYMGFLDYPWTSGAWPAAAWPIKIPLDGLALRVVSRTRKRLVESHLGKETFRQNFMSVSLTWKIMIMD